MSTTSTYTVTGMTCGHCAASVREEIEALPGVTSVEVTVDDGSVRVAADLRGSGLAPLPPVADLPGRRDGTAGIDSDSPPRTSDTRDPHGPVEEPEHPGWGIGGMPTWLDTPPVPPPGVSPPP